MKEEVSEWTDVVQHGGSDIQGHICEGQKDPRSWQIAEEPTPRCSRLTQTEDKLV